MRGIAQASSGERVLRQPHLISIVEAGIKWQPHCMTVNMRNHPEKRHLCSELVSILCGGGPLMSGNLEEIGEDSAVVLVDFPIRCHAQISIACEKHNLRGVVKSCTFTNLLGYLVEITLNVDSCWSPRWFTPKHLVAFCGNGA